MPDVSTSPTWLDEVAGRVAEAAGVAADRAAVPHDIAIPARPGVSAGEVIDRLFPTLLTARRAMRVAVGGATHPKSATGYPFLRYALQPALAKLGFDLGFELTRADFDDATAGAITVHVTPWADRHPPTFGHPGRFVSLRCEILLAHRPFEVAQRQLRELRDRLHSAGWPLPAVTVREAEHASVPGNAVTVRAICTHGEGVFTEATDSDDDPRLAARSAADKAMGWLAGGAAVQRRLARRLIVPMSLAGGGRLVMDGRRDERLEATAAAVTARPDVTCRLVRHRGRLLVEVFRG